MTELKTLKDLRAYAVKIAGTFDKDMLWCINKEELIALAVKWVKLFRIEGRNKEYISFMKFFNLTEEDLK